MHFRNISNASPVLGLLPHIYIIVRKVVYYSLEMEALGAEKTEEKMKMCDKLGDLCCSIKAFPAAIKFYEQQVNNMHPPGSAAL